jgi:hypothetical protein
VLAGGALLLEAAVVSPDLLRGELAMLESAGASVLVDADGYTAASR